MNDDQISVNNLINSKVVYFSLKRPTFNESAGFEYEENKKIIFLPVLNKYLKGVDIKKFTVRIGFRDNKYILVSGELESATSQQDLKFVYNEVLKNEQWSQEDAHYMLYDKRNGKPRKIRYKLKIKNIILHKNGSSTELQY